MTYSNLNLTETSRKSFVIIESYNWFNNKFDDVASFARKLIANVKYLVVEPDEFVATGQVDQQAYVLFAQPMPSKLL